MLLNNLHHFSLFFLPFISTFTPPPPPPHLLSLLLPPPFSLSQLVPPSLPISSLSPLLPLPFSLVPFLHPFLFPFILQPCFFIFSLTFIHYCFLVYLQIALEWKQSSTRPENTHLLQMRSIKCFVLIFYF